MADNPANRFMSVKSPKFSVSRRSRTHSKAKAGRAFPIPKIWKEQEGSRNRIDSHSLKKIQQDPLFERDLCESLP
jgi:hypothetical protein